MLIPSADVVTSADAPTINLEILFTHPMEQGPVMEMGFPRQFGVLVGGQKRDLLATLQAPQARWQERSTDAGQRGRAGRLRFLHRAGAYWEPAEKKWIIHYAKVVVDVLGAEEGWDAMVGMPVEIEPLVRPFGLWAGNTFRGVVKHHGKAVPWAMVEVEYYNEGRRVKRQMTPSSPKWSRPTPTVCSATACRGRGGGASRHWSIVTRNSRALMVGRPTWNSAESCGLRRWK